MCHSGTEFGRGIPESLARTSRPASSSSLFWRLFNGRSMESPRALTAASDTQQRGFSSDHAGVDSRTVPQCVRPLFARDPIRATATTRLHLERSLFQSKLWPAFRKVRGHRGRAHPRVMARVPGCRGRIPARDCVRWCEIPPRDPAGSSTNCRARCRTHLQDGFFASEQGAFSRTSCRFARGLGSGCRSNW